MNDTPQACRVCGCTNTYACSEEPAGCFWVETDLCSVCSYPDTTPSRYQVLDQVGRERSAQDTKWGEQNHPDGTADDWDTANGREAGATLVEATRAREACDRRFANGTGTWADILEEEYREALNEADPDRLRAELIQVAAVAVAWAQCRDPHLPDRRLVALPTRPTPSLRRRAHRTTAARPGRRRRSRPRCTPHDRCRCRRGSAPRRVRRPHETAEASPVSR